MKARRRNRLTSKPKSGLTRSVTTTVPMNSQRTASMPRCMPSASRAGRTTISAVSTQKKSRPATRVGRTSSRRMFEKPCSYAALPSFGMNFSATPLLHQRWLVGGGPSSKRCPWWPPQRMQWYSVRG